MTRKVLVVGGAGFIGSHVVDALLSQQVAVHVLDNFTTGCRAHLPSAVPIHTGDICDAFFVRNVLEQAFDAVVYLAAQVSVPLSVQAPALSTYTNVYGFAVLADALKDTGFSGKIIYASSAAVYGDEGLKKLHEGVRAAVPCSPYALEKQINEDMAALYGRLYGFKTLGLRLFNVYGPRQNPESGYAGVISVFNQKISQQQPITVYGDGGQTRDFVYVADVAQIICTALSRDITGVLNVGRGVGVRLNTLLDTLCDVHGTAVDVFYDTARVGDIYHSVADTKRLHQHFGAQACPTALEQGLGQLCGS